MSKKADDRVYKVKIQRPIFPPDAPFLAMSECGCIQPTLLQATPELKGLLGERLKVYCDCKIVDTKLVILQERTGDDW